MTIADSLLFARQRLKVRSDRRTNFASIDSSMTALKAAAAGVSPALVQSQKDFSSLQIINQAVAESGETAKNITNWKQNIAKLESDLAAARQAAFNQKVMLALIIAGCVAVWIFTHR